MSLLFLSLLFLASCKSGTETSPKSLPEPAAASEEAEEPAGYQLYSWEEHGAWQFSVLSGSNKLRSFEEVSADEVAVEGVSALQSRLRNLPRGAELTWSSHEVTNTEFPPDETIASISVYCARRGINLVVKH
jgi:hypothetical protein